jgi:hypothetical protein
MRSVVKRAAIVARAAAPSLRARSGLSMRRRMAAARARVARGDQEPVHAILDHVGNAADRARDHRAARGHGLQDAHRKPSAWDGRTKIAGAREQLVAAAGAHPAMHANAVGKAQRRDRALDLVQVAVARATRCAAWEGCGAAAARLQQVVDALGLRAAAGEHHQCGLALRGWRPPGRGTAFGIIVTCGLLVTRFIHSAQRSDTTT